MPIDPVVVLAEELRIAEKQLRELCQQKPEEALSGYMSHAVALYKELIETVPTSALGAAELIHLAAAILPQSDRVYARKMRRISDRMMSGLRLQEDLIWLRAISRIFSRGLCGEAGRKSAMLLSLAIRGAARPVIVYRAVEMNPDSYGQETATG
jgi:hypothetical protein